MTITAPKRRDSQRAIFKHENSLVSNWRNKWRFFSWNEDPVPDAATATTRALAGAAYLDRRFGPSWDERIDLDRLAIHHPFRCIAGQLGQWRFLRLTGGETITYGLSCGPIADLVSLFFRPPALKRSFDRLTAAWREVITDRRLDRAYRRRFTSQRSRPASVAPTMNLSVKIGRAHV